MTKYKVSGIIYFLQRIDHAMIHHDIFRTSKIDKDTPPETKAGRALLRAHGVFGRLVWRTVGDRVIKPLLKRGGERDYVILVGPEDKIYLTNPHIGDGLWRLPGGGQDTTESEGSTSRILETAEQTVQREAAEELRIDIDMEDAKVVFSGTHHEYGFPTTILVKRLASWPEGISPLASEMARVGRFSLEEIDSGEIPIDETVKLAIDNWRSGKTVPESEEKEPEMV